MWTDKELEAIIRIRAFLEQFGKVRVVEILAALLREAKHNKQEAEG